MSEAIRLKAIKKIRANEPIPYPDGPTLLSCQSKTINRFDDEGVASGEIRMTGTRYNHLQILRKLGLMFPKPYIELTKSDYQIYFSQKIKTNTRRARVRIVKRFDRWLFDLPPRTYSERVDWLKVPPPESNVTAADLWTEKEILALYRVADVQARARIGVLYDIAGRRFEVLAIRKADVQKTDFGYRITLKCREGSKTKGGTFGNRTLPLIKSHVYLTNWINEHPTWNTAYNPPLWVNEFTGEELVYEGTFTQKLKRLAKQAGISKNITSHILRHTKLTDCARMRMTESAMRKFAGWSPTSQMPALYVHLSGVHMEGEALRSAGADVPEVKPMFDVDKICPQCGIENELHSTYCAFCSSSLDRKKYVREEAIKIAKAVSEDEELENQVLKFLQKREEKRKKR